MKFKPTINKRNGQVNFAWSKRQIKVSPKEFVLDIDKRKGTIRGGKIKWV